MHPPASLPSAATPVTLARPPAQKKVKAHGEKAREERERVEKETHENRGGTVYDYEMLLKKGLPPPQFRPPPPVPKAPGAPMGHPCH